MGDRNNPIKFGPEWLRNLGGEGGSNTSNNNNQNSGNMQGGSGNHGPSGPGPSGSRGASGSGAGSSAGASASNPSTSSTANSPSSTGAVPKVTLANLRYGREEMLALYDSTVDPPHELRSNELLYQPRGKVPFALNNSFEDEMRENLRTGSSVGSHVSGLIPCDRFGLGRGMGRALNSPGDMRGRPRAPFNRQPSTGSGEPHPHHQENGQRPTTSQRGRYDSRGVVAYTGSPNNAYRSKRHNSAHNTNWRASQAREGGDEWRGQDATRIRQDRDRERGDRHDRGHSSRRQMSDHNDESMPEWAFANAEACGGTFDSSGAFHGYSNDDSNLPRSHEPSGAYSLTRSQTHNSMSRSKTAEEGSEEWWASEKAKKLSPKRFDAGDIKFSKQAAAALEGPASTNTQNQKANSNKVEAPAEDSKKLTPSPSPEDTDRSNEYEEKNFHKNNTNNSNNNAFKQKFTESKTFDAMMRSDINLEEANDERGNFKSVMINQNNSLRQKHQNIVQSVASENARSHALMMLSVQQQALENREAAMGHRDHPKQLQSLGEKIIDGFLDMSIQSEDLAAAGGLIRSSNTSIASGLSNTMMSPLQNQSIQLGIQNQSHPSQNMAMNNHNIPLGMQGIGMAPGLPNIGMANNSMNPLVMPVQVEYGGNSMGIQIPGMPPQSVIPNSLQNTSIPNQVIPNQGLQNTAMGNPGIQNHGMGGAAGGLPAFQNSNTLAGITNASVGNNSLFLGQNASNTSIQSPSDIPLANHGQSGIFPMHSLQHSASQNAFGNSMFNNIMQQPQSQAPAANNLADQWYYEDPEKVTQGPFTSREMFTWYRAGFFTPNLMVRRACDTQMRPLGSYGPVVPFVQLDMLPPYQLTNFESRGSHSQPVLGLNFESLWGQSTGSNENNMWVPQNPLENRVNNLPMYFWDQQPTAITSNSLLTEDITKEMKTEDQILAQLRASQNLSSSQPSISTQTNSTAQSMMKEAASVSVSATKLEDTFSTSMTTPYFKQLQKLMKTEILSPATHILSTISTAEPIIDEKETQTILEKTAKSETQTTAEMPNISKSQPQQTVQNKTTETKPESKVAKSKNDADKASKTKENNTKNKTKKAKEDKKEEVIDVKIKDEDLTKSEPKRSQETSPSKVKKEDKINKKELEKEKKEWIKEGFTIVKGSEKSSNKDSKKKAEEAKVIEDAERKRKEEEKLAAEEEKKRKQAEAIKKQQEQQLQQQRQATESVSKRAPWSAANQSLQATNKDGLTLAEIQRLEREKKLEQMKEQQQMMQIIAQQQAAAIAREQEMQAGLGWAKKKNSSLNVPGQSLSEIQTEARKQASVAAAAATAAAAANQALEEQPATNHVPWSTTLNGGFWETQPMSTINQTKTPEKHAEVKIVEQKKKKVLATTPTKKETTPAAEFELWCTTVLKSWSSKVDVPTFIGFLRDIESPYEVKDYVKCYLGESKDSSDFARQFLERRSKLLRVGMVTPSDDLCSPAMAVNPRTNSGSDYQEGKGKKMKKNKMLKVDARILGFSVTAAEDRINVGDIDTV